MLIITGLGNPGKKYAGNRHNIGFMAADAIAERFDFGSERKRFQGLIREGVIPTEDGPVKTLILKPQTYMNESGRAVGEAMRFYKVALDNVIVFYDELDLAPGKFRMKTGGGAAGHNGIRSISRHCGADFHRGRMGIGHPGHRDRVSGHVLSDFAKAELPWVEDLCDAIARAGDLLAQKAFDQYQTKVTYLAPAPSAKPQRNQKDDI